MQQRPPTTEPMIIPTISIVTSGDAEDGGEDGGEGDVQVSPVLPQPLLGRAGSGHWKTLVSAAEVYGDCALVR